MHITDTTFDAVAMMRAVRGKISAEIEGMTLEQALQQRASRAFDDSFFKRLRDRVARQNAHARAARRGVC